MEMEGETARRRIEMITAHFSATDTISATRLFPLNCSGGLSSIKRRCDNSMHFARQDSRSQACFMRPASTEQDNSGPSSFPCTPVCLNKVGSAELEAPLFSQPASTNTDVPKVRNVQYVASNYELPSSQPPKFARITTEIDVPMPFSPKNKTHATKFPDLEKKLAPRMDVAESGGKYIVFIELPGVSIDDIKVEVDNATLTVQTTMGSFSSTKILKGPFEIVWPMPHDVNPDSVSAEFVDGLLRITIPKLRVPVW